MDASESLDSDSDGIGNNADMDDDDDGLSDAEEATYGTNPLSADSDGDDYSDSDEIDSGADPLDANDNPSEGLNWHVFKAAKDQNAEDTYEGMCPLLTEPCMNIENHQACIDVEVNCDSEIVFLESCPLQFACPTESQSSP